MSECTAIVRMAVCGSGVGCFVMAPIANFLLGEEHKMNEFYKGKVEYFHFRCNIQLDLPVQPNLN